MITPFDFIERLRAWFFAKDRDITLQEGRTIVVTAPGVSVTINSNGVVVTGGDVTIDGDSVSVSGHTHTHASTTGQTVNDHHNQSHVLATGSALGPDHTISGAADGQVLRASGTSAARFDPLDHTDLTGVTVNQHHNEAHTVASHSDTSATGSELNTLTDGSDASSLHDHDGRYFQESEFTSVPGANSKPIESDSNGAIKPVFLLSSDDARIGGGITSGSDTQGAATGTLLLKEVSSPGTAPSGYGYLYATTSGDLVWRNDAGSAWTLNV